MTNHVLCCRRCGNEQSPGPVDYRCSRCGGELTVRYRELGPVDRRGEGLWRYRGRLPIALDTTPLSLGEGGTPLVGLGPKASATIRAASIAIKCEHLNPTGSFKDRIAAVAVTLATERGLTGMAGTSSGNGGAAAAAYCARAGLSLTLFSLADIPAEKLAHLRAFGATVVLVRGIGHDASTTERAAVTVAQECARRGAFPFLTGGRFSPEAMEGAKTIAYEILEQAPSVDAIYAPVGGGGLIASLGRALDELKSAGMRTPRLVAAQPAGCATLRPAMHGDMAGLSGPCTTTVSGLQVAVLYDGQGAVDAISRHRGHVTELDDEEIRSAQRILASDGILVEPAGATAMAAAIADSREGLVRVDESIVVLGTGAGFKDGAALARLADTTTLPDISVDAIRGFLHG